MKKGILFAILAFFALVLILIALLGNNELTELEPVSSEIQLIQTEEFNKFLNAAFKETSINEAGAAGRNLQGYIVISEQRIASKMIMRGISNEDIQLIEKGIAAIEYGFEKQKEDGSFEYSEELDELGVSQEDLLEAGAFFMQSVGQSYLLLEQSNFSSEYLPRLKVLKPKMELSMNWLEINKLKLFEKAKNAPNRLFFDALSFELNGLVLENENYQEIGDDFVEEGLKRQDSKGFFFESGGYDSSYQAVSLLKLQIYYLYSDNSDLKNKIRGAVEKGIKWEKTKIKRNGEIDVEGNTRTGNCQEKIFESCKDVNYREVILSFLYYGNISGDRVSLILAERIFNYAINQ